MVAYLAVLQVYSNNKVQLTTNKSVNGLANVSKTNLISSQRAWPLNSYRYLLKIECAVCNIPLITWKSPKK